MHWYVTCFVVKQEITALLLQPTTVTSKPVVSYIKKGGERTYLINSPDLIIPFTPLIVTFSNRPSLDTTKKKNSSFFPFSLLLWFLMYALSNLPFFSENARSNKYSNGTNRPYSQPSLFFFKLFFSISYKQDGWWIRLPLQISPHWWFRCW